MPFAELKYFSQALQKQTAANLILPDDPTVPWRGLLLLHGLSDDHTIWCRRTGLERYVAGTNWLIAMPDGGRGFYSDAVAGFRYETAMLELVQSLSATFAPLGDAPWAVSGLSMGGYGAVKLALRHPDRFSSATSLSGALAVAHQPSWDPTREPELERIFGPSPAGGDGDLFALAQRLFESGARRPALRIDCGVDDFLIDHNRGYHRFLQDLGFAHEYVEHPGEHNWDYWDAHIQESLDFHVRAREQAASPR